MENTASNCSSVSLQPFVFQISDYSLCLVLFAVKFDRITHDMKTGVALGLRMSVTTLCGMKVASTVYNVTSIRKIFFHINGSEAGLLNFECERDGIRVLLFLFPSHRQMG